MTSILSQNEKSHIIAHDHERLRKELGRTRFERDWLARTLATYALNINHNSKEQWFIEAMSDPSYWLKAAAKEAADVQI